MFSRMKSCIPGNVWPAIPEPAGATMLAVQYQLEKSQWLPPEQVLDLQLRQACQLLAHAAAQVPYYANIMRHTAVKPGSRLSLEKWRRLPILTRETVQRAGKSLLARQLPAGHGKINQIHTSGSTGTPVTAFGTDLTQFFWRAATLRDHLWHQRDFSAKFVAIRSEAALQPGKGVERQGWGPATDVLLATGISAALNIRTDVASQAAWLTQQRPVYLLSFPSNIVALARHFQATGLGLPTLREVRTYGEVAGGEMRQLCRETWGVPVTDMYSSQEVGYIALQCPDHEHYHLQEGVFTEVLNEMGEPCRAGEVGRVVVTNLHNFAMPLIRYQLGDYAELGEPCPCGRGLPVLRRIMGRVRNLLILPDGRRHWPSFPSKEWSVIGTIRQMQMVQHDLESIEARIVADQPLLPAEEDRLRQILVERFGHPFRIDITYHVEIPRSGSLKYEDFISEVPAA